MRYRKFIPVAVAMAATAVLGGCTSAAYADVQPNVIGGTPPTQNYPGGAKVSLQYDAPDYGRADWHTCGATLAFGRFIVTAAHCVTDPPPGATAAQLEQLARSYHTDLSSLAIPTAAKHFKIRVGSDDRLAGRLVEVKAIRAVHPEWKWLLTGAPGERAADVAVLELAEYVDDQYTLPLATREPRTGDLVYRLGWGVTEPDAQGPLPRHIRELKSKVVHRSACEPGTPYGWSPGDICVGNQPGTEGDGVCFGDSGGPLMVQIDGAWYSAGIVSRTVADGCGVTPESYTSTVAYRQWIYDTVRGVGTQVRDQAQPVSYTQPGERP